MTPTFPLATGLALLAFDPGAGADFTTTSADELAAPIRLVADGKPIDTGDYIAHSGPLLADYDGDGKQDLLVGNFAGHIQLFKNIGSNSTPELANKGLLSAKGETVKIHNW